MSADEGSGMMATCADCVHVEVCRYYTNELAKANGIPLKVEEIEGLLECDECGFYTDRSRFVELTTARKIKQTPDSEIMKEFHKLGLGKGMSERSIFWICSNCKMWTSLAYTFCPNCGAKFEADLVKVENCLFGKGLRSENRTRGTHKERQF